MPNIRPGSGHPTQPPLCDSQQAQPPAIQINFSWVTPSCTEQDAVWFDAQSARKLPYPYQKSSLDSASKPSVHNQFSSPLQPRIELP